MQTAGTRFKRYGYGAAALTRRHFTFAEQAVSVIREEAGLGRALVTATPVLRVATSLSRSSQQNTAATCGKVSASTCKAHVPLCHFSSDIVLVVGDLLYRNTSFFQPENDLGPYS